VPWWQQQRDLDPSDRKVLWGCLRAPLYSCMEIHSQLENSSSDSLHLPAAAQDVKHRDSKAKVANSHSAGDSIGHVPNITFG